MRPKKSVIGTTTGQSSGMKVEISIKTIANSMNWIPNQTNGISRGWILGTGRRWSDATPWSHRSWSSHWAGHRLVGG